jgi:organic radical activating enzyme
MFGRNIVLKPIYDTEEPSPPGLGQTLIVNSIWPTIQGEGPNAGCPAIFVRLTGCNLRCHFCDTEFEKGEEMDIATIVKKISTLLDHCATDLIVLTGGEPMRQQIIPMLHRFAEQGWMTQIETAGTVWPPFAWVSKPTADGPTDEGMPPGRFVTLDELIAQRSVELVCSPKTPKIHAKIEQHCDHYKYIAADASHPRRRLKNQVSLFKGASTMKRYIEVRLKDGTVLYLTAQFPSSSVDSDTNGATDRAVDLLKQLPAELLATTPRALLA